VLKAGVILAAGVLGATLAVVPALADTQTVTAGSNTWDKTQVAINTGESVTFSNPAVGGGFHNLFIDGTQVQPTGTTWTYVASGLSAGQHSYECTIHAAMKGTISVTDGTTTTTPPPPPATGPPPPPATGPTVTLARRSLGSFCVGGRGCRHPGVVVKLALDQPATVQLALKRGRHSAGTVTRSLPAGSATLRFTRTSRGRLKPGRYRAKVTATPSGGAPVSGGSVSFAVR
jgi:plastocyanin